MGKSAVQSAAMSGSSNQSSKPPCLREDAEAVDSSDFSVLGTVLELTPETVRLQVERARIAEAAAHLVNSYPVKDLMIEEEDVGTIISKIMIRKEAITETP